MLVMLDPRALQLEILNHFSTQHALHRRVLNGTPRCGQLQEFQRTPKTPTWPTPKLLCGWLPVLEYPAMAMQPGTAVTETQGTAHELGKTATGFANAGSLVDAP
jgi:hypothetical protein